MKALLFLLLAMSTAVQAQPLKVMSYNIRYDNPGDGVNQWSKRVDKETALIKKYDPDLIGLQEAMVHQIKDIIKALPAYAYVGVGRDDGKEKGEFSAILYKKDKFEVVQQKTTWLSETPDVAGSKSWDAAITRVLTWAQFKDKASNQSFFHFNTHFDHIGKEARKQSASLILHVIEAEAGKSKLPVVLTGDFNCEPSDEPYKVIMDSKTLNDARPASSKRGTYCTFEVKGPACTLIDHIFYTQQFTRQTYEVIEDNDGTYYPSDHLPVMVKLLVVKN